MGVRSTSLAGLNAVPDCKWPKSAGRPPETKVYGAGHGMNTDELSDSGFEKDKKRGRKASTFRGRRRDSETSGSDDGSAEEDDDHRDHDRSGAGNQKSSRARGAARWT